MEPLRCWKSFEGEVSSWRWCVCLISHLCSSTNCLSAHVSVQPQHDMLALTLWHACAKSSTVTIEVPVHPVDVTLCMPTTARVEWRAVNGRCSAGDGMYVYPIIMYSSTGRASSVWNYLKCMHCSTCSQLCMKCFEGLKIQQRYVWCLN